MAQCVVVLLGLLALLPHCCGVEIFNHRPRVDIDGHLMDVHDGNIVQWEHGGEYFWYGMGYRDCKLRRGVLPPQDCPGIYEPVSMKPCGFRLDHAINVYSSPNLVDWRFRGEALPVQRAEGGAVVARPEGIYFRPKVIHNARTQLYVLWVNRLPASAANRTMPLLAYPHAGYLVATSPTPAGPFTVVRQRANTLHSGGGDFDLLVTGPEAYLAYTAWETNHRVSIERLDDTFTDSTRVNTGLLSEPWNEAPVLMQRGNWFYLLYGETCCFCRSGGGARVLASKLPMGPWKDTGVDVAKQPNVAERSITKSQQSFVFHVAMVVGPVYVWSGDQWGTSPDGAKSHDLQYWLPMEWDDAQQPPLPLRFRLRDSFALNLTRARRPKEAAK